MRAYRHILPRRPLLQPRAFGILESRGARVGAATAKTRTAERHFRAPLPLPAAPAPQPAPPAPIQLSVTNIRLSPRFEVLIRNHMVATKILSVQAYSAHLASPATSIFIPRVATALAMRRQSAMRPIAGQAHPAARRNATGQLIMHHIQPPDMPSSSSSSPSLGKLRRPIAPWRVFLAPHVPDYIAGAPLADKRINSPFTARVHATDPSERRHAGLSYLHRRLETTQQITAIARRHLAVSHPTEALSPTRPRSVADRAQNPTDARKTAHPMGPSHKAPLKDRAPAAYAPLSAAVSAPARDPRSGARATATPALPVPTPRSFRASSPALPVPTPRSFRASSPVPTVAAKPEPKTAAPTPQPQAPQIDIQQLDKVLWQRFEKRLRVETERKGRG